MSDFLEIFVVLGESFLPQERKKYLKKCPDQPTLLGGSVHPFFVALYMISFSDISLCKNVLLSESIANPITA